jgi:hypothetical protein
MVSTYTEESYCIGIRSIYGSCLEDEDGQEVVDNDQYIADLEAALYCLWNQRNVLTTVLANATNKQIKIPKGIWESHDLIQKLVLFCITGRDFSYSEHGEKLYTPEQYTDLCKVYDMLPDEWKPAARMFIQKYAANYFKTEFATI